MSTKVRCLSEATVAALPLHVSVPEYDRRALTRSVVHIGVGGFHRAHQAVYFDDLATQGETGWGVVGVGLRRPEIGEVLDAQDGLFTVIERGPGAARPRVVGSMLEFLFAPDDPERVVGALAEPAVRVVTLTITGDGYLIDEGGRFRVDDPDVQHDLAHPDRPTTFVAFLVEALRRRRATGAGPFTVLSCDNLPDSGKAARTAVLSYAAERDASLARWIAEQVTFPSSMVDRITPETSPAMRDEIEATYGVPDRWPVVTEPFRQWVVEDDFCNGRPPLDRVGVQFVDDIAPYKVVKARVLNGGHSALGYLGALRGHARTDEAMADPLVREALERLLREEVAPLLPTAPGVDLDAYVETTLVRFANPEIGDSLDRLCRRGSVKMPSYLLPSLQEASATGRPRALLVLALAGWLRYLRGVDLAGHPIEVSDPRADALQALVREGGDDPRPILRERSIFGDLGDDERLVDEVQTALRTLSHDGLEAALLASGAAHAVAA
jgi:mannitol 2-dehydrogenase